MDSLCLISGESNKLLIQYWLKLCWASDFCIDEMLMSAQARPFKDHRPYVSNTANAWSVEAQQEQEMLFMKSSVCEVQVCQVDGLGMFPAPSRIKQTNALIVL